MGHKTLLSTVLLTATCGIATFAVNAESLFTPFPDAKSPEEKRIHYTPFELITAVNGDKFTLLPVSGKLTRQSVELPEGYSPEHVINNYLAQLKKLNAEVLFSCKAATCGDGQTMQTQLKPLKSVNADYHSAYVAAKLKGTRGEVYTSIYVVNREDRYTYLQVDILDAIPEPLDLIQANGDFLQQAPKDVEIKDRRSDDAQGATDHPLLGRMPGSYISSYKQTNFTQVPVLVGMTGADYQTKPLNAKLTQITYHMPESYSLFEINSNYAAAAQKLQAERVFHCKGTACGDDDNLINAIKLIKDDKEDEWQEYQLFKLSHAKGDVYFDIYSQGYFDGTPADTTLRVMELSTLKDDRVAIDLDALTDAISQTGKATLEGLLFDYDSERMLPESKPVLEVLASYLKQNPTLSFYVVGHTDDKGERSYNQSLSERRAAAVIKQLSDGFKIPSAQLTAHGNGEYSPVASNTNNAGQKLNRRVELVLRSDKK
ncbi:OmpA family protein [Shewanella decolorationis]|uniref:OmpA family protein n=1 Tax=Shewanella decolorationis TaxID=256839 RepID=UPI0010575343|nr:OmpA family protein [Shewanella decolorationis]